MTDDAIEADLSGKTCAICEEPIVKGDDAVMTLQASHLECQVRAILGDVQHLEGRCSCYGTERSLPSDEYASYRDSARATLLWLVTHKRGRFHTFTPHRCDLANCDGTRLGHELAKEFPEATARVVDALDRIAHPDDYVKPENLRIADE
jgi:hypothetical protein